RGLHVLDPAAGGARGVRHAAGDRRARRRRRAARRGLIGRAPPSHRPRAACILPRFARGIRLRTRALGARPALGPDSASQSPGSSVGGAVGRAPAPAGGVAGSSSSGPVGGRGASAFDPALLERVRARDPEALGQFYDRYLDLVFGLASRLLGDRTLAEDATSEVFLKVHRAADRLDPTRDPAPWLATIT